MSLPNSKYSEVHQNVVSISLSLIKVAVFTVYACNNVAAVTGIIHDVVIWGFVVIFFFLICGINKKKDTVQSTSSFMPLAQIECRCH